MDKHGNVKAQEGCDRCPCGAKYWEKDVCISCGAPFDENGWFWAIFPAQVNA